MRVLPVLAAGLRLAAVGAKAQGIPSNATGKCGDGTYTSAGKKAGACSGHGGLKIWYSEATNLTNGVDPIQDLPAVSTDDTLPAGKLPNNATGKCKDGTYTKAGKQQGACSGHGGLVIWYPSATNLTNGVTPQ